MGHGLATKGEHEKILGGNGTVLYHDCGAYQNL